MSPENTERPEPPTAGLRSISSALRAGAGPEAVAAARMAGEYMKEILVRCSLWEEVSAADRAAVHWAMVTGSTAEEWGRDPEQAAAVIGDLAETASHVVGLCEAAPYLSPRQGETGHAEEIYHRLAALPPGWRTETLRRVRGGQDLAMAIGGAQIAMNVLRARLGIDARAEETDAP